MPVNEEEDSPNDCVSRVVDCPVLTLTPAISHVSVIVSVDEHSLISLQSSNVRKKRNIGDQTKPYQQAFCSPETGESSRNGYLYRYRAQAGIDV